MAKKIRLSSENIFFTDKNPIPFNKFCGFFNETMIHNLAITSKFIKDKVFREGSLRIFIRNVESGIIPQKLVENIKIHFWPEEKTLASELALLPNITRLHLDKNLCEKIPEILINFKKLKSLRIENYPLQDDILSRLTQLESLEISDNDQITHASIGLLTSLQSLIFNNTVFIPRRFINLNEFKYSYPLTFNNSTFTSKWLINLRELKYLKIMNTYILFEDFCNLDNLDMLYLYNCTTNDEIFISCYNITHLILTDVHGITNSGFEKLVFLESLKIITESIEEDSLITDEIFKYLINLRELSLECVSYITGTGFCYLTNLTKLAINESRINYENLIYLKKLKSLAICNNNNSAVDVSYLTDLEELLLLNFSNENIIERRFSSLNLKLLILDRELVDMEIYSRMESLGTLMIFIECYNCCEYNTRYQMKKNIINDPRVSYSIGAILIDHIKEKFNNYHVPKI